MGCKKRPPFSSANEERGNYEYLDSSVTNVTLSDDFFNHYFDKFSKNLFLSYRLQEYLQPLVSDKWVSQVNKDFVKCNRVTLGGEVELVRNPNTFRAYYSGIIHCANPFFCPVCSPRIMSHRAGEIAEGVHNWLLQDKENTCYMFTLTFQHDKNMLFYASFALFRKALSFFWRNGTLRRILASSGYTGRITSTEINYGISSGWHPHEHILIFCKKTDFDKDFFSDCWLSALKRCRLKGLKGIALDITEARTCDKYLSKISSEIALSNIKEGRGTGHFTPFQLLFEYSQGQKQFGDLFMELYRGAKGFHPLKWSPGLKKLLGLIDVSDSDIVEGKTEDLKVWCLINGDIFPFLTNSEKAQLRIYASKDDRLNYKIFTENIKKEIAKRLDIKSNLFSKGSGALSARSLCV